jgi:hypothetical protein
MRLLQNLHDPTLPQSVQILSAKLFPQLVQNIYQKGTDVNVPDFDTNRSFAHRIIYVILEAFVNKFGALEREMPLLKRRQLSDEQARSNASSNNSSGGGGEEAKEALALTDYRHMLKVLVNGLKPIVWHLVQLSQKSLPSLEERALYSRMLRSGLSCCDALLGVTEKEEKEILDQFASVFTLLETGNVFRDVIRSNLEFLFRCSNAATVAVAQHFLTKAATVARCFGEILLEFMLPRLPRLGQGDDKPMAEMLVKLFKVRAFLERVGLKSFSHGVCTCSSSLALSRCLRRMSRFWPRTWLRSLRFPSSKPSSASIRPTTLCLSRDCSAPSQAASTNSFTWSCCLCSVACW